MFASYFEAGGPVMYAIFAAWVVVLAGVLDRLLWAFGTSRRRGVRAVDRLTAAGRDEAARSQVEAVRREAERGLDRIDTVSQMATSLGLFGTVLGIARSFFARGGELGLAAPEVLASGLATALFTTIAGLLVFLAGQAFLLVWREWWGLAERGLEERVEGGTRP